MTIHCTAVAESHADLLRIIRETAAALPADARAGVDLPDWRPLADGEPAELAELCARLPHPHYPHPDGWPDRAQLAAMHGPRADWGRIEVRYRLEGVRGSYTVERSRDALLRLADKIAKLAHAFGAAPVRKPARPRGPAASPITAAREFLRDGDQASALCAVGKSAFLGKGPSDTVVIYCNARPVSAGDIDWIIARTLLSGQWKILHAESALELPAPSGQQMTRLRSASDAESCLRMWMAENEDAGYLHRVARAVESAPRFDQERARARIMGDPEPVAAAPVVAPIVDAEPARAEEPAAVPDMAEANPAALDPSPAAEPAPAPAAEQPKQAADPDDRVLAVPDLSYRAAGNFHDLPQPEVGLDSAAAARHVARQRIGSQAWCVRWLAALLLAPTDARARPRSHARRPSAADRASPRRPTIERRSGRPQRVRGPPFSPTWAREKFAIWRKSKSVSFLPTTRR